MRPAAWGLILTVLGGFFWLLFSVVFGVASGLSSRDMGSGYRGLIDLTGLTMVFGIPAGLVGEVVRWRRGKKRATITQDGITHSSGYCHQCGKLVQRGLSFCGYCGSKL